MTTYPELLRRVLEDNRADTPSSPAAATNGDASKTSGSADKVGLALPQGIVDEALKTTRECLDEVCEMEGGAEENKA